MSEKPITWTQKRKLKFLHKLAKIPEGSYTLPETYADARRMIKLMDKDKIFKND